jgi:hypothetical protein
VRVFLTSGSQFDVEHPYIADDSLIWMMPERHGVPLAQIQMVKVRQLNVGATGLFVVLPVVLVVGLILFGDWGSLGSSGL